MRVIAENKYILHIYLILAILTYINLYFISEENTTDYIYEYNL